MSEEFDLKGFNQRVLNGMEERLAMHEMLAKYTKKTVALNKHLCNIQIMKEVIQEYKEEYNMEEHHEQ